MTAAKQSSGDSPGPDELLKEFFVDAELRDLTPRTRGTYRSHLTYFVDWLDMDPRGVARNDLKRFLAHLKQEREAIDGSTGLSQSTLNGYFSAINSFYKFLTYEGYLDDNPVPNFRERYLDSSRTASSSNRQLVSIEEMASLVHATLDVRDRAVILTLAKTGVRRTELSNIDLNDIDWDKQSIELKPTAKRSNTTVFIDRECRQGLERWLQAREKEDVETDALFTNQYGGRLKRSGIYKVVTKHAEKVGLHDPDSDDPQERFTPHNCRHWFTTHLRRAGMKREFIQELRGDTRGDAIDIYDHIDKKELREAYLAHIPTLGI